MIESERRSIVKLWHNSNDSIVARQVLITGANGFLGHYISNVWVDAGAKVVSLGRSLGNDIICDLGSAGPDLSGYTFDTVIHCAGKAHSIPRNDSDSTGFFRVNVEGTKKLLESISRSGKSPERVIFISSVAVYGRQEGLDIDETSDLDGVTPYAKSKIQAEQLVRDFSDKSGAAYFNFRLPLVVGTSPPGNLRSLWENIQRGRYIRVAHNKARKSMVLAEDVAEWTLKVDKESGAYNLTDREDAEFCEIEQAISDSCGRLIRWSISPTILKGICRTGDLFSLRLNRDLYTKLMSSLTYSSELAVKNLGWEPRPCLDFIREGGLSEQPGEAITNV